MSKYEAELAIEKTAWHGWGKGGLNKDKPFEIRAREGQVIPLEHHQRVYELLVSKVGAESASFIAQNLGLTDERGGINLREKGPVEFTLNVGNNATLATRTMDAGATWGITLNSLSQMTELNGGSATQLFRYLFTSDLQRLQLQQLSAASGMRIRDIDNSQEDNPGRSRYAGEASMDLVRHEPAGSWGIRSYTHNLPSTDLAEVARRVEMLRMTLPRISSNWKETFVYPGLPTVTLS